MTGSWRKPRTEKGIVLLDCMNPDERCIEIIENGFRDLALDIYDLHAIIISHGQGDHFGMAGYFYDYVKEYWE